MRIVTQPMLQALLPTRGMIRVYDFLAGLNVEYDQIQICVQLLSQSPFATLDQNYSLVHSEKGRRTLMLHPLMLIDLLYKVLTLLPIMIRSFDVMIPLRRL